jgi:LPS-assembly protein
MRAIISGGVAAVGLSLLMLGWIGPAYAQERLGALKDAPVLLSADQVTHDRDLGIVTAKGNVEISTDENSLLADSVSYNLKQDVITATGNVVLMDQRGEVTFVNYFELTGDLKNGFAKDIRLLMSDKSRMAALTGRRIGGTRAELDKAVYSPCKTCEERPENAPLWQIKAEKVTHDQDEREIVYRDATFEFFGIPIAYTPYLSHPDPSVKRRSGFLIPTVGYNKNLGARYLQPYFWNISPHEDVTLTPMVALDENPMLAGEHRRRFVNGETLTRGSLTHAKDGQTRGHIDARGLFDLNEAWRAGYLLERSTDDTYQRIYGFRTPRPWLTSRPYIEGFSPRTYVLGEGMAFQGLRQDYVQDRSAIILPHLLYSHTSEPGKIGGHWDFDTSALSLQRLKGDEMQRVATRTGWNLPFQGGLGDQYKFSASMRADGYRTVAESAAQPDGFTGRAVPQAALEWRFPFQRSEASGSSHVVEPVVVGIASPHGGNPARIPNEDSRYLELSDSNIFEPNRFPGFDRLETGPRINFGGRWRYVAANNLAAGALLGQSYRMKPDSALSRDTGLDDNFSDYVGRFDFQPSSNINLAYRYRLDKDDLSPHRQEITAAVGPPLLRLSADYLFYDRVRDRSEFGDRHQIAVGISSALTQYWRLSVNTLIDLTEGGGPLSTSVSATYEDECFLYSAIVGRNYTYDRDFQGGFTLLFRFSFKNLGELPLNVF